MVISFLKIFFPILFINFFKQIDNEWKDCDFEFEIRNISETVLIIQLDSIPDCISIPKYLDKIQVEPLKTLSVRAVFSPLNVKTKINSSFCANFFFFFFC